MDYERCPFKYRLKYIDKIPEPDNPFSGRGIELHQAHEDYITGKREDLHPELAAFSPEINSLRQRYVGGTVLIEDEWAFDNKWQPSDWRDYKQTWVRIKLDAFVLLSPTVAIVIDGKTGKKYGNEIKHAEQGQLYSGATFLKKPDLEKVIVEFHYWDAKKPEDRITTVEYQPRFAVKAIVSFEKRARTMLNATTFPPRPNIFNCGYCSYGRKNGNGHCKASV